MSLVFDPMTEINKNVPNFFDSLTLTVQTLPALYKRGDTRQIYSLLSQEGFLQWQAPGFLWSVHISRKKSWQTGNLNWSA